MKRSVSGVISTSIFAYIFWLLFIMQDVNIIDAGAQELIVGAIISIIFGYLTSPMFIKEDGFWLFKKGRIFKLIAYIPCYLIELIKANIDVAKRAFSKNINPGIVKVKTELQSDYGLSTLANSITLTPGTIVLDICEEDEKNYMYIHWIDVKTEDEEKAGDIIKGKFEQKIRGFFK